MTIITTNDDDDDDDDNDDDDYNTNINDYSVILLKVYFLCFVATELFFPSLPLFLKKKEKNFARVPVIHSWTFLLTYPCWCWWTVLILFACSPCIAMSLLSLNYSICIDFFFIFLKTFYFSFVFERTTFWWHGPVPGAGEGGAAHGCTDSCAFSWFFENCTQTPSRSA